ncbi:MAG: tetratricopeptide repeat protein [Bacteroidia bacterium]|nr:tetratricopeptide repeat protein [Bacteroidia bacterium]
MKTIFAMLAFLVLSLQSFACFNEYHVNDKGEETAEESGYEGIPVFYRSFDLGFSQRFLDAFYKDDVDSVDYKDLSDLGVHLARLGHRKQALKLMLWLNQGHPNEYNIIANLGTLYELNGNLDSASYFIGKALELNKDSHHGSEWVHLAILKAKKEITNDPEWVKSHNVLGLDPKRKLKKEENALDLVRDSVGHVFYQLEERIPYTPEPNILMAKIMVELGAMLEKHLSIGDAVSAYRIAEVYDPEKAFDEEKLINNLLPKLKKSKVEESPFEGIFPPKNEFRKIEGRTIPFVERKKAAPPRTSAVILPWILVGFALVLLVYGIMGLVRVFRN